MFALQEVVYGTPLYEAMKQFRDTLLRKPLGLILTEKDTANEHTHIHLAAIQNTIVVGTVLLAPLSTTLVKLRQMAVHPSLQGNGLGKQLVLFAEKTVQEKDFTTIEMHARVSAQLFYEKLGYLPSGEPFIEVTVSTIRMKKVIMRP